MNSDQYFHRGLRLIVASVLVFFLIVLFCVMVSRGFPFWMALVLLVPAGLCVAGLYYFSIGTSVGISRSFSSAVFVVSGPNRMRILSWKRSRNPQSR